MLSVSSFESEGLSLGRRPRAGSRIFVFIRALGLGQPGKFFKCMIGGIPTQRFPPPPHPQEHHGTGDRKGAGLGVFSPSKNLSNTAEPLEE